MNCELCSGELQPYLDMPLDSMKEEPTPFHEVKRCVTCGTGVASPAPKMSDIAGFYELPKYYTHGTSHIPEVAARFKDKVLTKLAWLTDRPTPFDPAQMAKLLPAGASVCDLGAGAGVMLKCFQDLGLTVLGVEPDPAARDLAVRAAIPVLPGTAEAPGIDGEFDLVLMTHSLEHCLHAADALSNAYRLTKPGGYLYCEVPNCACSHFRTFTLCSVMFDLPRHLWFFTPKGLKSAIEAKGYEFDSWRFEGFTRHFSPGWRAYESNIAWLLAMRSIKGRRHTFWRSTWLLTKSALAPAVKKYDSVGVLARKARSTSPSHARSAAPRRPRDESVRFPLLQHPNDSDMSRAVYTSRSDELARWAHPPRDLAVPAIPECFARPRIEPSAPACLASGVRLHDHG